MGFLFRLDWVTRGKKLFSPNFENLGLQQHNLSSLDAPISEEEVHNTTKLLPNDKAPGPDGFTEHFYKACWDVIKGDVVAAINAAWRREF
jgi:hypothetical protein